MKFKIETHNISRTASSDTKPTKGAIFEIESLDVDDALRDARVKLKDNGLSLRSLSLSSLSKNRIIAYVFKD